MAIGVVSFQVFNDVGSIFKSSHWQILPMGMELMFVNGHWSGIYFILIASAAPTSGQNNPSLRYLLGLSGIERFGKSSICNVGGLFRLPTVLDNGSTSRHPGSTNLALTGFIIAPKATGGSTPLCRHFSNHGIFGFIPLSRLGYRVILSTALFSNARNLSC